MRSILGASWKTSLAGYVGAISLAVMARLQSGSLQPKDITLVVIIAVLGRLGKDFDVTGKGNLT
jgi:hypothetical protein